MAFVARTWGLLDPHNVRRSFRRVLKAAGLPLHFTPHCLRHTYASLLLIAGVSVYYVQRQLGNASIQLTCDSYGKWLPPGNKAAVDLLDSDRLPAGGVTAVVTPTVANRSPWRGRSGQSGPPRIRTADPLIIDRCISNANSGREKRRQLGADDERPATGRGRGGDAA